jgi:CubicO group peptidase (beta-lactamase class C family)
MWVTLIIALLATQISEAKTAREYFPPPESEGGWRTLSDPDSIRRDAGMDPAKLAKLREWLRQSDHRQFAAVVIRRGHLVMQVERGKSAVTDNGRIASCSKAICATVLAIASEESQKGRTPRKMTFDDPAFEFIPWAQPLSDPRKARITVKQLLNHTSGIHGMGSDPHDPKISNLPHFRGTRKGNRFSPNGDGEIVCPRGGHSDRLAQIISV